jgi:hypothetical protein
LVKHTGLIFVLSLVTALILACTVPVADQPETSFNEADTPVNQATVIAPIRIAPPSEVTAVLPAFGSSSAQETKPSLVAPKSVPLHRASVPLHSLLCTFLV